MRWIIICVSLGFLGKFSTTILPTFYGAKTLSKTRCSQMALSMKGLFTTISLNGIGIDGIQHKNSYVMQSVKLY
jgi:hypothetical protein